MLQANNLSLVILVEDVQFEAAGYASKKLVRHTAASLCQLLAFIARKVSLKEHAEAFKPSASAHQLMPKKNEHVSSPPVLRVVGSLSSVLPVRPATGR